MTNQLLPLVSIITPVFNQAELVRETVESVLAQDYPSVEYIVLDDGSSDGTASVLAAYAKRVRLEAHSNIGETRTVNKGFSLARGEIIGVVSSDDPLRPGAISRIVQAMTAHPEVLVAYPDWEMIDPGGARIRTIRTHEYCFEDMIRWHHCVPGPGTLFRRRVVDALGGRDPQFRFVGDFDFWLRAGLLGSFMRVPEVLATFRVHPASTSVRQRTDAMAAEHIRLVAKFFDTPNLSPRLRRLRREAYSSAHYVAGVVSGTRPSRTKLKYFAEAVRFAPLKYLGEYRPRILDMAYQLASFWNRG